MTRAEFAAKVRKMVDSGLGVVAIGDYDGGSVGHPYRLAHLGAEVSFADGLAIAAAWLALAIDVRGYLTVHTTNGCGLGISVSVNLDAEPVESGAAVSVESVLAEGGGS